MKRVSVVLLRQIRPQRVALFQAPPSIAVLTPVAGREGKAEGAGGSGDANAPGPPSEVVLPVTCDLFPRKSEIVPPQDIIAPAGENPGLHILGAG